MICKYCGEEMRIKREDGHADCIPRIKQEMELVVSIGEDYDKDMQDVQDTIPNPLPTKGV